MNVTELAHWRCQFDRFDSMAIDDLRHGLHDVGLHYEADTIAWLREEARYMVALGELTLAEAVR